MGIGTNVKIAILGGSFNPVHEGHIALARAVLERTPWKRVLFVPAARSPFKARPEGATDAERLAMLDIALSNIAGADIWDGELRREPPSYTFDTIVELENEGIIADRPGLVIGRDLLDGLEHWHRSPGLLDKVDLIVADRACCHKDREARQVSEATIPFYDLGNTQWPFSSSDIRHRIAEGHDVRDLLPCGVAAFIKQGRLYEH